MTEKHTPGPWMAWQPRADESVPVRTDGLGITIAYVHQGAITNAKANARLIAAAPEMLDALKRVADSGEFTSFSDESWDVVNAAIAKAEGMS